MEILFLSESRLGFSCRPPEWREGEGRRMRWEGPLDVSGGGGPLAPSGEASDPLTGPEDGPFAPPGAASAFWTGGGGAPSEPPGVGAGTLGGAGEGLLGGENDLEPIGGGEGESAPEPRGDESTSARGRRIRMQIGPRVAMLSAAPGTGAKRRCNSGERWVGGELGWCQREGTGVVGFCCRKMRQGFRIVLI